MAMTRSWRGMSVVFHGVQGAHDSTVDGKEEVTYNTRMLELGIKSDTEPHAKHFFSEKC